MSVTLTGTSGFFTRHGMIIGEYNRVATFYGSALDDFLNSIWAQYATADQQAIENLPSVISTFRNTGAGYQSTLVADGNQTTMLQVSRDTSVVPYTVAQALTLLRDQMIDASQSINRPTLGSTVTPNGSNLGDSTLVVSTTNIYGDPLDMTLNETFTVTCNTAPSSYQASLSAVGQPAVAPNSYNWPQGSGASTGLTINDPAVDGLISDGGFADWEGTGNNTPTNWDIINGDAGVTIFRSAAGGVRAGTDAAQITSDGAQATQLGQTVSLSVNTVYAVTFSAKINTTTATGTFRIALTDGDGNVLSNDAGTALSYTRNLNGEIDTTYAQYTAFFSTPRQLPTTTRLFVGTSVAATAARVITIDLVSIVAATPLYGLAGTGTSGPFVAAFAYDDPTALSDSWTAAFTNSLGTQSFVMGMERLYSLRNMGVYIPSDASPTISDSLVTY